MATVTAPTVPSTLSAELVERLARVSGQPVGVADVALSMVPYGSRQTLIAHEILEPVDDDDIDAAVEIVITAYGREVIEACAEQVMRSRESRSAPATPRVGIAVSPFDAIFLGQEGMEVGAVATFHGPPPPRGDVLKYVRARLDRVPRYRHKLVSPILGPQRWVEDPTFNVEYHVRFGALAFPGDHTELERFVGGVFSQRLDRSKPLWEIWVVGGLAGGRFAVISKTHLAMIDNVSGRDLMRMLYDVSEKPPQVYSDPRRKQQAEPSSLELTIASLMDTVVRRVDEVVSGPRAAAAQSWRLITSTVEDPLGAAAKVEHMLAQFKRVWRSGSSSNSPLDVAVSAHRRVLFVDMSLDDFKRVKNAFRVTVNDVVLAVIAGGLRAWMLSRDLRPDECELKAAVPVSARMDEKGERRQGITQMVAALPVDEADPVERLKRVAGALRGSKDSKQALGADVIANMPFFASPAILAQASRLHVPRLQPRRYDLVVANVPGPQEPLFFLTRRVESLYPVAPLTGDAAVAIAVMSYDSDRMHFSVIADTALPDIDVTIGGMQDALRELVDLSASMAKPAGASTARAPRRPASARVTSRGR